MQRGSSIKDIGCAGIGERRDLSRRPSAGTTEGLQFTPALDEVETEASGCHQGIATTTVSGRKLTIRLVW